jgi:hypothetical protein
VICGPSGGFIGDRQIPKDYVVVMWEVFIENAITKGPFNVNANNTFKTIFF